jgi:hypothetical protein
LKKTRTDHEEENAVRQEETTATDAVSSPFNVVTAVGVPPVATLSAEDRRDLSRMTFLDSTRHRPHKT